MKTIRIISMILLVISLIQTAGATDRTSLRSLGMGRTAVASSRGTDAIGINPANIAIPDIGHFNLSLVNTNFRISTELFTYDIYQKYFTDVQALAEEEQDQLTPTDSCNYSLFNAPFPH